MKMQLVRHKIIPIVSVLILAILIELFIFNFRHFESLFFSENANNFTITYSENIRLNEEGELIIGNGGEGYIELNGIDSVVNNLHFDVAILSDDKTTADMKIGLSVIDEGNSSYYKLPARTIDDSDELSKYIKLNLSGEAKSIRIYINELNGDGFKVNSLLFNVEMPMDFSVFRVMVIFLCSILIYIFRPSSQIYQRKLNLSNSIQKIALMICIYIQIVVMVLLVTANERYVNPAWTHHQQYQKLAVALTKGQFYLDDEPSEELMALENPYDKELRESEDVSYIWDQAYYNGRYYVYFGVVPVLLLYLPYYVLTGSDLPNYLVIIICEIGFLIGIMMLLKEISKRFFKNISFGTFILVDVLFVLASGSLILAQVPTIYSIPIIMGLMFTSLGLYFWLSGIQKDRLVPGRILSGSICMALVAGCRPQLLLGSFLCVPVLVRYIQRIVKQKKITYQTGICATCFVIPYVVVAAFLMYYNYSRFGQVFDFGANYNLTTNDMTNRGFKIDRIFLGLFTYLFQPLAMNAVFPFLTNVNIITDYQGITIYERMYGGILMLNPILWINFYYFKARGTLKKSGLSMMTALSILFAFIIVIVNTQMAGILPRYFGDFGIFLALPMAVILFSFYEKEDNKPAITMMNHIVFACTIISVTLTCLWSYLI